jgi:hypothetical protein
MAIKTTKTRAAAVQDALLDGINEEGGSNAAGTLRIYDGAVPADLATSPAGNLLASCALVDGSVAAFGATNTTSLVATGYVSGGKFAEDASANASGTATFWRILDYAGAALLQGTIGTSGADLNLDTLTIVSGTTVTITAFTVTASTYT